MFVPSRKIDLHGLLHWYGNELQLFAWHVETSCKISRKRENSRMSWLIGSLGPLNFLAVISWPRQPEMYHEAESGGEAPVPRSIQELKGCLDQSKSKLQQEIVCMWPRWPLPHASLTLKMSWLHGDEDGARGLSPMNPDQNIPGLQTKYGCRCRRSKRVFVIGWLLSICRFRDRWDRGCDKVRSVTVTRSHRVNPDQVGLYGITVTSRFSIST